MQKVSRTSLNVALLGLFATGLGVLGATGLGANESASQDDNRKTVTEKRTVSSFTEIDQLGSVDIVVTIGKTRSVEVKADSRMVGEIETYVEGKTLIIKHKDRDRGQRNRRSYRNYRNTTVYITVPNLEALNAKGSGDTIIDGLKADDFELQQRGSGDVELNGSCKTGEFDFRGSGDFEADDLKCTDVEFTQRGSGDIDLNNFVVKTFVVDAIGSGEFDITGSCDTMDVDHRASGDFNARNFKCKSVDVTNEGSGGTRVYASEDVSVSSNGSGDVDIYGGGKLGKLRTRGSGDIETHN